MELIPIGLGGLPLRPVATHHRRRIRLIVAGFTVIYLLWLTWTNWGEVDRAVLRIGAASGRWLGLAILIEVAAQLASGLLMRRLLIGAGHRLSVRRATQFVLAQNAVGLVVPGGPVAANTFAFRHLRRSGVDSAATTWVLAGASAVSMLAVVTIGIFAASGIDLVSLIAMAMLVSVLAFLVMITRHPSLIRRPAGAVSRFLRVLRRQPRGDLVDADVDRVVARLGAVRLSNRDWVTVLCFAMASATADCLAFACCTRALIRLPTRCMATVVPARLVRQCARFRQPTLSRILLVYVAGQATLLVPFVPGGIGPVEAAMTSTFVAGHIRVVPALSAVLLYRLLSYWGVVLVGLMCWRALRRRATADQLSLEFD